MNSYEISVNVNGGEYVYKLKFKGEKLCCIDKYHLEIDGTTIESEEEIYTISKNGELVYEEGECKFPIGKIL